jgi:hypothetical protein
MSQFLMNILFMSLDSIITSLAVLWLENLVGYLEEETKIHM